MASISTYRGIQRKYDMWLIAHRYQNRLNCISFHHGDFKSHASKEPSERFPIRKGRGLSSGNEY